MTPLPQGEAERLIADTIQAALGQVPVLLAGSRATGAAMPASDYDVSVVLPTLRIPFVLARLKRAAASAEAAIGAPVVANPVPAAALTRREPNLFVWKLETEAKLLAAPPGFGLAPRRPPLATPRLAFSYLASAAFYLVERLEPADVVADDVSDDVVRGMEKALLHVVQLELLERGSYRARLDDGLAELRSPRLSVIADHLHEVRAWFLLRDVVVRHLRRHLSPRPLPKAIAGNLRHAAIATLRGGPGWRAAFGISSTEVALVASVIALLAAVRRRTPLDSGALEAAWLALPRKLRPAPSAAWGEIRDVVVREWANAHPLVLV